MSQPVDAKAYYGYLFEPDKKPTKVLSALLRSIANYIRENLGNKEEKQLTPDKLAAFYKAVGGNYDSLFVEMPHNSISWIYASIGCQHTHEPTADDFSPPSVPALTTAGFVRWQSIEILLGPDEHVPFIQTAVKSFSLKHPDTGEPFPPDLPKEAFPTSPDPDIERWHNDCAERLRQRATPNEPEPHQRPDVPPRPKATFAHVRPHDDYFEPKSRGTTGRPRPLSYAHVSGSGRPVRPGLSQSPSHRARQFLAPEDTEPLERARRRSFPENLNGTSPLNESPLSHPQAQGVGGGERNLNEHMRRHSHSHSHSHSHVHGPDYGRRTKVESISSDASSEDDSPSPTSPDLGRRRPYPPADLKYHHSHQRERGREDDIPPAPAGPPPPVASVRYTAPPERRPREHSRDRERERENEAKRRSFPIPIDLSGKLSAPFLFGKRAAATAAEPRSGSRSGVRWKDLDGVEMWGRNAADGSGSGSGGEFRDGDRGRGGRLGGVGTKDSSTLSEEEARGPRPSRDDRDRDRERDRRRDRERERDRDRDRDRDRERERDRDRERERARDRDARPRPQQRSKSSNEDARKDRDRDRDRDLGRGNVSEGRSFKERAERERDRDRDRDREFRGVDGRRYPAP